MKRYRIPTAKVGELKACYGNAPFNVKADIQYCWGGDGASSADGRILCEAFEGTKVFDDKTLRQVLTERGYDITTLKFSIQKRVQETP